MTLPARLFALRTEHGLCLRDLAARTGLRVTHLSDIERGRVGVSREVLDALAVQGFGLSVEALLSSCAGDVQMFAAPLPPALEALMRDEHLGVGVTPEWAQRLLRMELRGRRPSTKEEWYSVFLILSATRG